MLKFRCALIAPLSLPIFFYTAAKEISWILLTMTIKLMLSRLLIRLPDLNIDNPYFEGMVSQIYPPELQFNKAKTTDAETSFLDLHLSFAILTLILK